MKAMLRNIFIFVLLIDVDCIRIGTIDNGIMIATNNVLYLNSTLNECVCAMIQSNGFISALNYFQTNQTCELFNNSINQSLIRYSLNSYLIFINQSFISSQIITTAQPTMITSASPSMVHAFWPFDGDMHDRYSNYDGVSVNNVSFYSPGINGYGSALSFNASLNQSVLIASTVNLNISFQSFTFELWIYPFSLAISPSGDRGMIGQCLNLTANKCLHMTLRGTNSRISFYSNPCTGATTIITNTWYHLTFVYDYTNGTQMIYINGILDCIHSSSAPLQIPSSVPLTIGVTYPLSPFYFDGLIDQVSLIGRVKNITEILDDATLVVYYPFNNNSFDDYGPNEINGTGINATFENNSILLNGNLSYFQASGFVLLGTNNRSYSFSVWINPFQINGSTILHVSSNSSSGGQLCSPFIGFNSIGKICAQSRSSGGLIRVIGPFLSANVWTHIAQTYSLINGVSLYVNGSLFNKSAPCDYQTNHTPLIVTLGSSLHYENNTCTTSVIQPGQFSGWMDEFRIYSRELTAANVQSLAVR